MSKRKKLHDQAGVTMIIALVFFLVISLACLTFFHAASGAIKEARNYSNSQKAEILAGSMSEVVQDMIQNGVSQKEGSDIVAYSSMVTDSNGKLLTDGRSLLNANNPIAQYLIDNLDDGWTYYNEDQALYSDKSLATKTLTLDGLEDQDASGEISMYWTWDSESKISYTYETRKLYVKVAITVGDETATNILVFNGDVPQDYTYSDGMREDQIYWWTFDGEMR